MTDIVKTDPADIPLDSRAGWPADLRLLIDRYPREVWGAHANLGAMARFWLQRHDMFREIGDALDDATTAFREGTASAADFRAWFPPRLQFFLQQLNSHHQVEDLHYFPVFQAAEQRLAHGFDVLETDHAVIHAQIVATVESANAFLRAAVNDAGPAARGRRPLCRDEQRPAAPADPPPRRRGRPDHPADPRPRRGLARGRMMSGDGRRVNRRVGLATPHNIFIHRRTRQLRIATMTITSSCPRLTDRGSDETGRVRVGSAVTTTGRRLTSAAAKIDRRCQSAFVHDRFVQLSFRQPRKRSAEACVSRVRARALCQ